MPVHIVKVNSKIDAPRNVAPDNPLPTGKAKPPGPPPAPVRAAELSNRRKFSLDCKKLCLSGAGHLLDLSCVNLSAGTRYLMLFDSDTLPDNGVKPARVWTLATLTGTDQKWSNGLPFQTGICLALSSTLASLTVVTAGDGLIDATFLIQ